MSIRSLLEFHYAEQAIFEYMTVFALQLSLYIIASGVFTVFYKTLNRLKIGSRIELREKFKNQFLVDVKWSISTCAIIALYFYMSLSFIDQIYPSNFWSAIANVIVFIVVYDLYMYLTHRALHTSLLRRFHSVHHTAISATPWSCLNMHPVEALINYLPFLLFAYLAPVSLLVFLGIHVYLIFGIANGHSNYTLAKKSSKFSLFGELSTFHQRHHSDGRGNYGYLFTHYDWAFRTRHLDS